MNILVLNCGSSSVKFQIIATDMELIRNDADGRLGRGSIEPSAEKQSAIFKLSNTKSS